MDVRSTACERAAQFVSLELDGELSLFERAILKRHLLGCPGCEVYAREIRELTALVRAAPVEEVRLPIHVSHRGRRVQRVVQSVAASAAVVALGVWLGLESSGPNRGPSHVVTLGATPAVVAVTDNGGAWAAGIPRTLRVVQVVPGGLYTAGA